MYNVRMTYTAQTPLTQTRVEAIIKIAAGTWPPFHTFWCGTSTQRYHLIRSPELPWQKCSFVAFLRTSLSGMLMPLRGKISLLWPCAIGKSTANTMLIHVHMRTTCSNLDRIKKTRYLHYTLFISYRDFNISERLQTNMCIGLYVHLTNYAVFGDKTYLGK